MKFQTNLILLHGLLPMIHGLTQMNGLTTLNGLTTMNGLMTMNGLPATNGLPASNGLTSLNGLPATNGRPTKNGLTSMNGSNSSSPSQGGWNSLFVPYQYSKSQLGNSNWIDPELLGPDGVGNLENITSIQNNTFDNRHIPEELKMMICNSSTDDNDGETTFMEYFLTLIRLAWPTNTELWICCNDPAGINAVVPCTEPDYKFNSVEVGFPSPVFAPHFLTEKFERGQQEALTAALIAEFNTVGQHLLMDIHGRLDLGMAGTRFFAGRVPEYDYYLGNAWGNAFLTCDGDDRDDVLCQASAEKDRTIGRNPLFFGIPMFTCSGESDYPTRESGKACFSKDMETNEADGCGFVASVGPCSRVCVGGFCGANDPPLEYRGTTNVLYVYLKEYEGTDRGDGRTGTKFFLWIAIPFEVLIVVALWVWVIWKHKKLHTTKHASVSNTKDAGSTTDAGSNDGDDDFIPSVTLEI